MVLDVLKDDPVWHVMELQIGSFLLQPRAAIDTAGAVPDHVPCASVAPGQTWAAADARLSSAATARRGPRMPENRPKKLPPPVRCYIKSSRGSARGRRRSAPPDGRAERWVTLGGRRCAQECLLCLWVNVAGRLRALLAGPHREREETRETMG